MLTQKGAKVLLLLGIGVATLYVAGGLGYFGVMAIRDAINFSAKHGGGWGLFPFLISILLFGLAGCAIGGGIVATRSVDGWAKEICKS